MRSGQLLSVVGGQCHVALLAGRRTWFMSAMQTHAGALARSLHARLLRRRLPCAGLHVHGAPRSCERAFEA